MKTIRSYEMTVQMRKKARAPEQALLLKTSREAGSAPPHLDYAPGEARADDAPFRAHRNEQPGTPP